MYPFGWSAGPVPCVEVTFKDFQDKPALVHQGAKIAFLAPQSGDGVAYLIRNFSNYHGELKIGELVWLVDVILDSSSLLSMLRCWMDCNEDMMLAKLTWHPGY